MYDFIVVGAGSAGCVVGLVATGAVVGRTTATPFEPKSLG
jgi:pyruvate/2-oxoglutarate dehydrogenase complex dihydrolipoamide dehydrogenase (E3) component